MSETGSYPESAVLVGAAESVWGGSEALVTIRIGVGEKLREAMRGFLGGDLELVFITDSDIRHIRS